MKKNDFDAYFFNDLYSDELITNKFASFQNRLYHSILRGKESIQQNKVLNGPVTDIIMDETLNLAHGMPARSYSLHINECIVPYYSEEMFAHKYGYEDAIPLLTLMDDTVVFSKHLYFFINGYFINNIQIHIGKNDYIIFIPTTDEPNTHMNRNQLDEILSEGKVWSLFFSTKSDFYAGYTSRLKLFTGTKIYTSNLKRYKAYNRLVKRNAWTMYITAKQSSTDIMIGTSVTMGMDDTGEYFEMSQEFYDYIYDKSINFRCLIVNEPDSTGNGIYINTNETRPIFTIPFEKNPIPIKNLIIWKYDHTNGIKQMPLAGYEDVKLSYPNIYDFTDIIENKVYQSPNDEPTWDDYTRFDLFIEWVEPTADASAYDTYLQDYMDCYAVEFADMIVNKTAHPLVLAFKPLQGIGLSAEDYFNSEFKGDYRGWRLQKFIEMMGDNPNRYDEVFELLYYINKKYLSKTYTYDTHPHVYDRNIITNRNFCEPKQELVIDFPAPQGFLRIHDFMEEKKPTFIYVNGIRHEVTYVSKWGHILYIYFPVELIENKETIQLNIDFENVPPFNVSFIMGDSFDLGTLKELGDYSLSELIFYDAETGEIFDSSVLDFVAKIEYLELEYLGDEKIDAESAMDTDIGLYDYYKRKFVPAGEHDCFIVKKQTIQHPVEDPENGKKVPIKHIIIYPKPGYEEILDGKRISITTTNFHKKYIFTMDKDYITENGYTYTIPEFKGKGIKERFRVYLDGKRTSNFKIEKGAYNTDFKLVDICPDGQELIPPEDLPEDFSQKVVIEHIGFDEVVVLSKKIKDLKKTNDEILYLEDDLDTPYNRMVFKVYVDGYRISDDQIKMVGQGNMIMIIPTYYQFTDESTITIYQQGHDKNFFREEMIPYQFLDEVAQEDERFRKYLIDKYKNS